jgi:hypothetical protein
LRRSGGATWLACCSRFSLPFSVTIMSVAPTFSSP